MKPNSFSTFELADLLLSQTCDWVLVRVQSSYAVFENLDGEFLLTRSEIIEQMRRQGLIRTGAYVSTSIRFENPITELRSIGALL